MAVKVHFDYAVGETVRVIPADCNGRVIGLYLIEVHGLQSVKVSIPSCSSCSSW